MFSQLLFLLKEGEGGKKKNTLCYLPTYQGTYLIKEEQGRRGGGGGEYSMFF